MTTLNSDYKCNVNCFQQNYVIPYAGDKFTYHLRIVPEKDLSEKFNISVSPAPWWGIFNSGEVEVKAKAEGR